MPFPRVTVCRRKPKTLITREHFTRYKHCNVAVCCHIADECCEGTVGVTSHDRCATCSSDMEEVVSSEDTAHQVQDEVVNKGDLFDQTLSPLHCINVKTFSYLILVKRSVGIIPHNLYENHYTQLSHRLVFRSKPRDIFQVHRSKSWTSSALSLSGGSCRQQSEVTMCVTQFASTARYLLKWQDCTADVTISLTAFFPPVMSSGFNVCV